MNDADDEELTNLLNEFKYENRDIILYNRSVKYIKWRSKASHCKHFKMVCDKNMIGYIWLEKIYLEKEYTWSVLDYVILNKYISLSSQIIVKIAAQLQAPVIFRNYPSCQYSKNILKEILKSGYLNIRNPFRKINVEYAPIYCKKNGNDVHVVNNVYGPDNWLITPNIYEKS